MTLTTLALIVLWPLTLFLILRAIATSYAAWGYSRNKLHRSLNSLRPHLDSGRICFSWKLSILRALCSVLLLACFQGWVVIA